MKFWKPWEYFKAAFFVGLGALSSFLVFAAAANLFLFILS